MTNYRVRIVAEAERDIIDIHDYVASKESTRRAAIVLGEIEKSCIRLAELPLRGHVPPELERIGVNRYREIHYKPYRIIYEVVGKIVYVHCVFDGRRDLQAVLERRLLR